MEQLIEQLLPYCWSESTLRVWAKSDFRCAYCDTDMLARYDVYRHGEVDHVLPQSKYASLADVEANHVLSCRVCNLIKRAWLPDEKLIEMLGTSAASVDADLIDRVVDAVRAYIAGVRLAKEQELTTMRGYVRDYRRRLQSTDERQP